ncbi:chaperonin 10-like protein [Aspergillus californicus]
MTTTNAIVAWEPLELNQVNWSLEEIDVGTPGEGEVLVEMCATGICHTDLVLSSVPGGTFGVTYPKVLGHEGSGYIRALGPHTTTSLEVGDPVLLSYYSCSMCSPCRNSHPAYCDAFATENYIGRQTSMSLKKTGGIPHSRFFGQSSFAQYSIIDEASIVNVKDLLRDPDELRLFAPLGCGFQTGMGAICNTGNAGPKDTVMIMGLGAVGMGALMTATIRKCETIIVVDRIESRLEHAKTLGASHGINTSDLRSESKTLKDAVLDLISDGVSVVIDTTGVPALIEEGLQSTRKQGKLVLIGVPPLGYGLNIDVTAHINSGRSIVGCIEGDCIPSEAIPQMIEWYREGRFPIDQVVQYFKASEYQQALAQLKEGAVVKPVLLWD